MPQTEYKVVGALDTETANIANINETFAFPVLYQLGTIDYNTILNIIDKDNVEEKVNVNLYRNAEDLYGAFDALIEYGKELSFVPIVAVHNLSFDMYSLGEYLLRFEDVRTVAKSTENPLVFTLYQDDEPVLCFWDTVSIFCKSLETMGRECGLEKKSGDWDYSLIRTPETELTPEEIEYAEYDIYVLFAYIGYYLRLNPVIDECDLGHKILTKTSAVRYKREKLIGRKHPNVIRMWRQHNQAQRPATDDELQMMHSCTRGGYTFTATRFAGVPLMDEKSVVIGFDATSQHPAQMVSHYYPQRFEEASPEVLELDMEMVKSVSLERLLDKWFCPFPRAMNFTVYIEGLRVKPGTVFERDGIALLSFSKCQRVDAPSPTSNWDTVSNPAIEFGKVVSCDAGIFHLTELEWWCLNQVYEYDFAKPVAGYETGRWCPPTDFSSLSVMMFYRNKNTLKNFIKTDEYTKDVEKLLPGYIKNAVKSGRREDVEDDLNSLYTIAKSELNSLFGIEITNEARPDYFIDEEGIEKAEFAETVDRLPKMCKSWYQYGQRIVGWSRVAQVVMCLLLGDRCDGIVNGDTDSIKVLTTPEKVSELDAPLKRYAAAVAKGVECTTTRVRKNFPDMVVDLPGLGEYIAEFTTANFYSSGNKAYARTLDDGTVKIVMSGLQTNRGDNSYNKIANRFMDDGFTFDTVCELMLGYNITVGNGITGELLPKPPTYWGRYIDCTITDYRGVERSLHVPEVEALVPMPVLFNSDLVAETAVDMQISLNNNPNINTRPTLIDWYKGGLILERW